MPEELIATEDTMSKVYNALLKEGLTEAQVINCVNNMQNDGILFRERASV